MLQWQPLAANMVLLWRIESCSNCGALWPLKTCARLTPRKFCSQYSHCGPGNTIIRAIGHQNRGQRLSHTHTWLQTEAPLFSESCFSSTAGKDVCLCNHSFFCLGQKGTFSGWSDTRLQESKATTLAAKDYHIHIFACTWRPRSFLSHVFCLS